MSKEPLDAATLTYREAHDPRTMCDLLEAQWVRESFAAVESTLPPREALLLEIFEAGRTPTAGLMGWTDREFFAVLASLQRRMAGAALDGATMRRRLDVAATTAATMERRAEASRRRALAVACIRAGGSDGEAAEASGLDVGDVRRVRADLARRAALLSRQS